MCHTHNILLAIRISLLAALGVGLAGCTVGPDYKVPHVNVPDQWHCALSDDLKSQRANMDIWWETFNDPILNDLIRRARANNKNLKIAVARIAEAGAQVGIATGEHWPRINADGSLERKRSSEEIVPSAPKDQDRTDNFVKLGLDTSWEIDLWGRIKRGVESSSASLESHLENYRDVLVLLYADIANNYIELRSIQQRIRYARSNVEAQQQTLQVVTARLKAQLVSELDLWQAQQNLAQTEAVIPTLQERQSRTLHRIATLIGEYPGTLGDTLGSEAEIPATNQQVPLMIPADLIRQRPDIRKAERELAAQTARIGIAEAELYPQLSLSGAFAFHATTGSIGDVFSKASQQWSFGPSFRWNLFNGGRIRSRIDLENARTQQALIQYEQAILEAVEQVESALNAYQLESTRYEALRRSVEAARKSIRLVGNLYQNGLADFQNVLDSRRTLIDQEDALAHSKGLIAQHLVQVYRAMGGGWPREDSGCNSEQSHHPPDAQGL